MQQGPKAWRAFWSRVTPGPPGVGLPLARGQQSAVSAPAYQYTNACGAELCFLKRFKPFGASRRRVASCALRQGMLMALLMLLLQAVGGNSAGYYEFDDAEVASYSSPELPLPRPFDTAACALQRLAQQQQLLRALQQVDSTAGQLLAQDETVKAYLEAGQSGVEVKEVREDFWSMAKPYLMRNT